MRVVLDYYFDDLEQRCTSQGCKFVVGPYSEEWVTSFCPDCQGRLGFFRAFGTEAQRSVEVRREQARISGIDY
jgi:hypothetical protein